jgi:hypothetical protein
LLTEQPYVSYIVSRSQTKTLTITFPATLLGQDTALDTLLHPLRSSIRPEPGNSALTVVQLAFVGGFEFFFLVLVDLAVVRKVGVALSDDCFAFDVVTRGYFSPMNSVDRRQTYYASKACRRAWLAAWLS